MGKGKLAKFADMAANPLVVERPYRPGDEPVRLDWHKKFFKNDNPIVLELGCGRGEYTVGLGRMYSDKNFIGVDIKGARMWRGAKTATENAMPNVGFLRTRIEFINSFFAEGEVDEIWVTFPDPQLRKARIKKRLTGPIFLGYYSQFLKEGAAADIIVMDYKPFTPFSDENIDGHMIFGMTGRQCQTTIGNGKLLMLDRQLVDIDEEAVNAHILEESKKLWGALNNCEY